MSKLQGGHVPQCPIAGDANASRGPSAIAELLVLSETENARLHLFVL